jgi:hypothetical protein
MSDLRADRSEESPDYRADLVFKRLTDASTVRPRLMEQKAGFVCGSPCAPNSDQKHSFPPARGDSCGCPKFHPALERFLGSRRDPPSFPALIGDPFG